MPAKRQTEMPKRKRRPATSPEARENQLISYAMDLAEQRLLDGTASSQEVVHFLKLGTQREKLEREKLRAETDLVEAKRESLKSQDRLEELYTAAMSALKGYSGGGDDEDV